MKFHSIMLPALLIFMSTNILADWALPRDLSSNPRQALPRQWKFGGVERRSNKTFNLDQLDSNAKAERMMFSQQNGNPWSQPSIRINNFRTPAKKNLEMRTSGPADSAIIWTSPINGMIKYQITVTDPKEKPKGSSRNAEFKVIAETAKGKQNICRFSWFKQKALSRSGELNVSIGDKLIFQKTTSLKDDYGNSMCLVNIAISQEDPGAPKTGWSVLATNQKSLTPREYRKLNKSVQGNHIIYSQGHSRPKVTIHKSTPTEIACSVLSEKDSVSNGAGSAIVRWICPESNNYILNCSVANVGTDRKGGDGGYLKITYLKPDSELDSSMIGDLRIPNSRNNQEVKTSTKPLKISKGEIVQFRFYPGRDGYADCFRSKIKMKVTSLPGKQPATPTPELLISQPPEVAAVPGAPIRDNLFWLGSDGNWANGPMANASIDFIKEFIPNLGVIMVGSFPERFKQPDFYREMNIPTLIQSFGSGYESYWRIKDAFEYDKYGRNHAHKNRAHLSGNAHAAAHPHPAFIKAFTNLATSAIKRGFSGYGFNDMVWFWGAGRGAAAHSTATIKAFRKSLKGEDEGLTVTMNGGPEQTYIFADYAKYYMGTAPKPSMLGLRSWDEYSPLTQAQLVSNDKKGISNIPSSLVRDMLTHYEWLKSAQRIGKVAEEAGGFFQCMPNPEDLANGNDLLFLSALKHVKMNSEEYFNSPVRWQGAYFRYDYLQRNMTPDRQHGIVLEAGHGGNGKSYYDNVTGYQLAYDITLSTKAQHIEGDFWVQSRHSIADTVKNPKDRSRYQILMMYGMAYKFGLEDNKSIEKYKPDFVSFTSRRIFGPWGYKWHIWNDLLDNELSPDQLLAENGYVFEGRGTENLQHLTDSPDTVLYSPAPPTSADWDALMKHLKNGRIKNAFTMASCLQNVMDYDYKQKKFSSIYPKFKYTIVPGRFEGSVVGSKITIHQLFKAEGAKFDTVMKVGNRPLVVRYKIGRGNLYVLLFAPTAFKAGDKSPDAAAGLTVWSKLLKEQKITTRWKNINPKIKLNVRLFANKNNSLRLVSIVRPEGMRDKKSDLWRSTFNGNTGFKLRVKPNQICHYVTFPDMRTGEVRSDAKGWINLEMKNRRVDLFYISYNKNNLPIKKLKKRLKSIHQAVTLGGKTALPSEFK